MYTLFETEIYSQNNAQKHRLRLLSGAPLPSSSSLVSECQGEHSWRKHAITNNDRSPWVDAQRLQLYQALNVSSLRPLTYRDPRLETTNHPSNSLLYLISRLRFLIAVGSRCPPSGVAYSPQHRFSCMCVYVWDPRTQGMQDTVTAMSTHYTRWVCHTEKPFPQKNKQTNKHIFEAA